MDCEYNSDAENGPSGKKQISFLKDQLLEFTNLKEKEHETEGDLLTRAVFPDIIVHQRGTNERNLCIIEVKKPGNKVADAYDHLKLEKYTSSEYGNHLKYQLAVFVIFTTGEDPKYSLSFFKEGNPIEMH